MLRKLILIAIVYSIHISVSAQKTGAFSEAMKKEMAGKIVDACRHAWNGYKQYAWGKDDLQPLSKTGKNWHSRSLLMTPIDSYDTFIMLGMTKEASEAKKLIFDS